MPPKYQFGEGYRELPAFDFPLADSRQFPKPFVRVVPDSPIGSGARGESIPRNAVNVILVDHARTALFLIARLVAPGRVWVPAYHCPAMVEPLVAAGCEVAFYPIKKSLRPDHGYLVSHARPGESVVGVRYFGFDTGIKELAALCASEGVLLIEDLAHAAYFDEMVGNFGVTSLLKFLPIRSGGELLLPKNSDYLARTRALHTGLPSASWCAIKQTISKLVNRLQLAKAEQTDYRYFRSDLIHRGLAPNDQAIVANSDHRAIVKRRRANYKYLAQALSENPNGVAMFPHLPDHVVPYVFPFLLTDDEGFGRARLSGVQALRWEELVPIDCRVVGEFRTRLIQLPVHQGLDRPQLDAIAAALAN